LSAAEGLEYVFEGLILHVVFELCVVEDEGFEFGLVHQSGVAEAIVEGAVVLCVGVLEDAEEGGESLVGEAGTGL
jgi:hypothetical protein